MPAVQPLLIVVLAALAAYTIAFAGVAALHFQPYIAPLLVGLPPSVAECRQVQDCMNSVSTCYLCFMFAITAAANPLCHSCVHARLIKSCRHMMPCRRHSMPCCRS